MSKEHEHRFDRLSDVAIFCACGEIKESPFVPVAAYPFYVGPVCTRPHYPTITPSIPFWQSPFVWGSGDFPNGTVTTARSVTLGSTYISDGTEQSTYTGGTS